MHCRAASFEDLPRLTEIWKDAFPDDTIADIQSFLQTVSLSTECFVAEDAHGVQSMVFSLPAQLMTAHSSLPLQYIYAAATATCARGRGLFGTLLRFALNEASQRGCAASFLRPAQPSLCEYYARFGYQPFFYCDTLYGTAASEPLAVTAVDGSTYALHRQHRLPPLSVDWPSRFLQDGVLLGENGVDGCAVCQPSPDGTLYIRELLCNGEQAQTLSARLASHFGCAQYETRIPTPHKTLPVFGLLKPLHSFPEFADETAYMGIAFD